MARELVRLGHQVRCLVRSSSNLGPLAGLPVNFSYGDVTEPASLPQALAGATAVIHLAAIIRERGAATFQRVNHQGTANLVAASREAGGQHFIYMSNIGVSPDPRFPFLLSKWQAEHTVRESGLPFTIFRSSVMFGPGDGFLNVLARLLRRAPVMPIIGSGRTKFQLIFVADTARCLGLAVENKAFFQRTVEIGGPEHLSYEELVDIVMAATGRRRLKIHLPVPLMKPVVWLMERVLSHPPLTTHQLSMLAKDNITALNAVESAFGFKPVPVREGIDYLRSR